MRSDNYVGIAKTLSNPEADRLAAQLADLLSQRERAKAVLDGVDERIAQMRMQLRDVEYTAHVANPQGVVNLGDMFFSD